MPTKRFIILFLVFVFGLSHSSCAFAAGDGIERRWATIIGVGDYFGDENDLNGAVINANRMHSVFDTIYGFDSELLVNTTKSRIQQEIQGLAVKADEDDIVAVYFSGHSKHDSPWDWSLRNEYISNSEITSWLNAVKSENISLIVDSCHSGSLIDDFSSTIGSGDNNYLIASALASEKADVWNTPVIGGGIFTTWFLDGMTAGNVANNILPQYQSIVPAMLDGKLTMQEVFDYAENNTVNSVYSLINGEQHPQIWPGDGNTEIAELNSEFYLKSSVLRFVLHSPADLVLTDSFGNVLSKTVNDFGDNAFYFEGDFFDDGELHDIIEILFPIEGEYTINVLPALGAELTETFSLQAFLNSNYYNSREQYLAYDVMLRDIPLEGYSFQASTVPEPSTCVLLGFGILGLLGYRKRKKQL